MAYFLKKTNNKLTTRNISYILVPDSLKDIEAVVEFLDPHNVCDFEMCGDEVLKEVGSENGIVKAQLDILSAEGVEKIKDIVARRQEEEIPLLPKTDMGTW
ncbi:hypothetical protein H6G33_09790 [Calothrix sp. FACHB-1219]|uniref:hypothetical protein n=1 Tax=unclassified Calothrix TaxID=2619626 RepID=UPI00168595B6|nr:MULTISPECIES: hypothetical protein [unclassified Calothrix]MBD2201637.1 hypothetical protein [Calothrix sp. FACHB-168]MBD2217323.1 hypothetical protein [Calothrix sp. FACHB-1219]